METRLLELDGTPIGYFEIERENSSAKIAIFGLLGEFHGRGLGGHSLTLALERAFEVGPRVWLTTCSLDGPNALPNYLKRGLEVFRRGGAAVVRMSRRPVCNVCMRCSLERRWRP